MAFTRLSYLVVGLICLVGIFSQWVDHPLLSLLWRSAAAIFLLLLTLEGVLARYRPYQLKHSGPDKLQLGYPGHFTVQMDNPSQRSLEVQTQFLFAPHVVGEPAISHWRIEAQSQFNKAIPIVVTELQKQSLATQYIRLLGQWRLAWWSRKPLYGPEFEIEPRMLKHQYHGLGYRDVGQKKVAKSALNGRDLMSLREFQAQDPLRNVDWKATAKRGKPIVRVYAEETSMDLIIVIDAGRSSHIQLDHLTRLHHYINVSARLAELAIQRDDRVALIAQGQSHQTVPLSGGITGLRNIRAHLQSIRSCHKEFNPLSAALRVNQLIQRRSLVIFFTEIEENDAATQLLKANKLLVPKHRPLIAGLIDPAIADLKNNPGESWMEPYYSYAASEYEHSRSNTVLNLQRQGAKVVLAKPDQLDAAVLNQYELLRYQRSV